MGGKFVRASNVQQKLPPKAGCCGVCCGCRQPSHKQILSLQKKRARGF